MGSYCAGEGDSFTYFDPPYTILHIKWTGQMCSTGGSGSPLWAYPNSADRAPGSWNPRHTGSGGARDGGE